MLAGFKEPLSSFRYTTGTPGRGFFMADYLLATPYGFYFRMKVPPELRVRLGKRELKKALNTSDKKRARLAAILYAARATEIFDLMRGVNMGKFPFFGNEIAINGFKRNADGSISFDSLTTDQTDSPDEKARILSLLTGTVSTPSSTARTCLYLKGVSRSLGVHFSQDGTELASKSSRKPKPGLPSLTNHIKQLTVPFWALRWLHIR
jgi:hypothetical protein